MISVKKLQNYALYLYFFFVNFQELSFFGVNNFSIPKFTILIYLVTIMIQHKDYIKISYIKNIIGTILAFFGLLKCLLTIALEPSFIYIYPFLVLGIIDAVFKLFYQIDLKKLVAYSTVVEMH